MEKITYLAKQLKNSARAIPYLSSLTLQKGELFSWNHTACAITYNPTADNALDYLLHEYAHALLQHSDYSRDIELIKIERAAWDMAQKIAPEYAVTISEEVIDTSLNSYRDWLHSRSLCPHCQATGIQISQQTYRCLACATTWQVNEARSCQLRRRIKKRSE